MAVWTTANARAAMVGPVLVCLMAFTICWFQARTTLSPVAACAAATPTRAAVSPTLTTRSTARMMGSLRAAMASTALNLVRTGRLGRSRGQGEAVEPPDSSRPPLANKIDMAATTAEQGKLDSGDGGRLPATWLEEAAADFAGFVERRCAVREL